VGARDDQGDRGRAEPVGDMPRVAPLRREQGCEGAAGGQVPDAARAGLMRWRGAGMVVPLVLGLHKSMLPWLITTSSLSHAIVECW
jgi:hypothetical protein